MMSLLSIKINFFKTTKILNIFLYILSHLIISNQIQYNEQDLFSNLALIWLSWFCRPRKNVSMYLKCLSVKWHKPLTKWTWVSIPFLTEIDFINIGSKNNGWLKTLSWLCKWLMTVHAACLDIILPFKLYLCVEKNVSITFTSVNCWTSFSWRLEWLTQLTEFYHSYQVRLHFDCRTF